MSIEEQRKRKIVFSMAVTKTVEVILRAVISVNQFSFYEAVAGWISGCYEFIPMSIVGSDRREPMEFEWKNFPGFIPSQILAEIQNMMTEFFYVNLNNSEDRIIFMSMYNDTVYGGEQGNKDMCVLRILQNCSRLSEKIRARTLVVSWAWIQKSSGTELIRTQPNGEWDRVAEDMMLIFSESGHPVFRAILCFGTMRFEKQREGTTCLFTSVATTTPLNWFFARSLSVNQLSINGAVADMCDELACRISGCSLSTGIIVAQNNPETMVIPTELSTTNKTPMTNDNVQGKLAARLRTKIRKSSRSSSFDPTVLQCWYHEDCGERTVCHDPRRCGT